MYILHVSEEQRDGPNPCSSRCVSGTIKSCKKNSFCLIFTTIKKVIQYEVIQYIKDWLCAKFRVGWKNPE